MPALPKDNKLFKRIQTTPTNRVHSKSLSNTDVKRLGPSRRISTKRTQSQGIQTETVLACLLSNNSSKNIDEGTQTAIDLHDYGQYQSDSFATRLIRFLGGTVVSFIRIFNHFQ